MSLAHRYPLKIAALAAVSTLLGCERDTPLAARVPQLRSAADNIENLTPFADPSGAIATYSTNRFIDAGNPFFQSLGTNGRTCASCHQASDAFGLSAAHAQARFASSGGTDPLFAAIDGANCPTAAPGDAAARSLLLNNGLIRIFLPVPTPAKSEFILQVVHDPYSCALVAGSQGPETASVYRRPLPTTNLGFLSAVMFDGRETLQPLNNSKTFLANLQTDLSHQALDATLGHAQAVDSPTIDQRTAIVNFELALFTAQQRDDAAGELGAQGASGGAQPLASQQFYPGINDALGGDPTGAAFNPEVITDFTQWLNLSSRDQYTDARKAVARGEELFNTHPINITDVRGLNDALSKPVINGTCTTCHDSPNVGNHSLPVPLDIGTSHDPTNEADGRIVAGLAQLKAPDLPIFHLTCTSGASFYTSDPGKALISGHCADIGRIKGPILRGLAARAPYFHNGAAASLTEVVNFYNQRFQMGLTDQEKADLVAFLKSL